MSRRERSRKQKSITRRWTHQSEARHPLMRGQRSRSRKTSRKKSLKKDHSPLDASAFKDQKNLANYVSFLIPL